MFASVGTPDGTDHREQLLPFWESVPAVLYDRRLTVLDSTPLARILSPAFEPGVNLARFSFLSPERRSDHPRWHAMSSVVAGLLKESVDQHDDDRPSQMLLGELLAKSREFSERWAQPDRSTQTSGPIEFENTAAGYVRAMFAVLRVPGYEDNSVLVFAASDEPSRAGLDRLRSSSPGTSVTS